MDKMNTPKLRFKEFADEWQEKTLGDIADFYKGAGLAKEETCPDGQIRCVRYGELYTNYNEIITTTISGTNLPKNKLFLGQVNDILIPSSGETSIDIAKASCVQASDIAFGGDLNVIRTKSDGVFLSYYLNNSRKKQIARLAQGNSVVHLYSSQLKGLGLILPSTQEQTKIAKFLSAVGEKIDLLEQKKKGFEKYKKGVMQAIFSQKIRFRKPDGSNYPDWEEKRLGEVTNNFDNKRKPISSVVRSIGDFPYYGANGIVDHVDGYIFDGEHILVAEDGVVDATKYSIHLVRGKFWANNHAHVLTGKNTNNSFLYYALQNTKFARYITGSAQSKLNSQVLGKIQVSLPVKEEQEKIADFLTSLDSKVDLINKELEQTKLFKKSLLQQMFV